jgi:hypothetical protein
MQTVHALQAQAAKVSPMETVLALQAQGEAGRERPNCCCSTASLAVCCGATTG